MDYFQYDYLGHVTRIWPVKKTTVFGEDLLKTLHISVRINDSEKSTDLHMGL